MPSDALEVIQGLVNKQFDVIVSNILNKDIILPTPLLPLSNVLDVNSKVYGAFSLIISSVDDLQSFMRSYLHSKEEAPYETGVCFIVDKRKVKNLKRILPQFKLLHQFESNSGQWHVYLDEPRPCVLSQLTLSSQLMMSFSGQVAHHDAYVSMDSAASHCFVNSGFAKTCGLDVKKSSITLVLGNDVEVPTNGHIKVHIEIQQYQSQIICMVAKLNEGIDLILGNDWLVQHKARLDFESKCCVLYKGRHKMTVHVNPMQCRRPNPHRSTPMQFKRSIRKGATSFLVQLIAVGDDVEDTVVAPYATVLEEYADVFQAIPTWLPPEREMAHTIPLEPDDKPPFRPIYRLSPLDLQMAKKHIKEYLEKRWIEPSSSPYGSPILFVKKKWSVANGGGLSGT